MGAQTSKEVARRLPKQVRNDNLSKPTASPSSIQDDHRQSGKAPLSGIFNYCYFFLSDRLIIIVI